MVRHINLKDLRPNLPRVVEAVDRCLDRFVVTKRGAPVAVILSPDDYHGMLETIEILADKAVVKRLKKAKREACEGRTRTLAEIDRAL